MDNQPVTDFQAFLKARDSGALVETSAEIFDYFLDVLPPVSMGETLTLVDGQHQKTAFEFAEGFERTTAFWQTKDATGTVHYFAQHTARYNPHAF